MTKVSDKIVKVYEYQIDQENTLLASFEDGILVSLRLSGKAAPMTLVSFLGSPDNAYDLYNALDDLFKETGLDSKNKNVKKLKVSTV